jgi:hypothetical protein
VFDYHHQMPPAVILDSTGLSNSAPIAQTFSCGFDAELLSPRHGSLPLSSAKNHTQWLHLGVQEKGSVMNSNDSAFDGTFTLSDGPTWVLKDQFGFMDPLSLNHTSARTDTGMNLPQEPIGGLFDPLEPISAFPGLNGDMFLPIQDFNNLAPPLDQPARQQTVLGPVMCALFPCPVTFERDTDRIRHEATVHKINQGMLHLCAVPGYPKGRGNGYSCADKLTEHMWKKHGNLGFVKRI